MCVGFLMNAVELQPSGLGDNTPMFASGRVSNVSAYGTNYQDCIREDFRLIEVTEGNEDETEIADTTHRKYAA